MTVLLEGEQFEIVEGASREIVILKREVADKFLALSEDITKANGVRRLADIAYWREYYLHTIKAQGVDASYPGAESAIVNLILETVHYAVEAVKAEWNTKNATEDEKQAFQAAFEAMHASRMPVIELVDIDRKVMRVRRGWE